MKKVPIKFGDLATVLKLLGTLYRTPADALKEHVSNAVDEHLKAQQLGKACPECRVVITLEKDKVVIEYPYGMSEDEFQTALQRVADSAKKDFDFAQIGRLGIGIFSFFQIGNKGTFISQKNQETEQVKVIIRENSDNAEFERVRKSESLTAPGIRIIISGLRFDPTQKRGPLSMPKLQKVFAEKFNAYLRDGWLKIKVCEPGETCEIEPLKIELPPIGQGYENWYVGGNSKKPISLELYYDPSGKGIVAIRHAGVTIVEDIKTLSAYGLEESVYAVGYVRGFIDANFLTPLPARTGFEEDQEWLSFLAELDKIRPSIESEVEMRRQEEAQKKLTEIQKKAFELVREILDSDQFKDLELLLGEPRKTPEPRLPPNGFDFIPASVRIEPGKMGAIPLKAVVPRIVPNESVVSISIDNPAIQVLPKRIVLKGADADENGVITIRVSLFSKTKTSVPAILTAKTEGLQAEARVRVAELTQIRELGEGRINYEERPFEEGPSKHSRCISKILQINTLNPDYKEQMQGSDQQKLFYAALMIGKETLAFNDKTERADEFLERLLTFLFQLKRKSK